MKIKSKLTLGNIAIALFIPIVGAIALFEIHRIEKDFDIVTNEILPIVEALEEMQFQAAMVTDSAYEFAVTISEVQHMHKEADPKILEHEHRLEETRREEFEQGLKKLEDLVKPFSPKYDLILEEVQKKAKGLLDTRDHFIRLKKDGITGEAILELELELDEHQEALLEKLRFAIHREEYEVNQIHADLNDIIFGAKEFFLISAVVGFIMALVLGVVSAKIITSPLILLTKATSEIAKAKFDTRVDVSGDDEVVELAHSFNIMVEDLSKTTVSRDYFQSVVSAMNNSLIILEPSGNIKEVNHATCYMLGYKERDLIGKSYQEIIDEKSLPEGASGLEFLGFTNHLEVNYLSKQGASIPVLFSGATMSGEDGEISGYVYIAQDSTELNQLKRKLTLALKKLKTQSGKTKKA